VLAKSLNLANFRFMQPSNSSSPWLKASIIGIAATAALFHLYAAGVQPFTALVQRPVHLALMGLLGFLGVGIRGNQGRSKGERWLGWLLSILMVAGCVYLVSQNEQLVMRSGASTGADIFFGSVVLLATLELARRAAGWGIVVVAIMALTYALVGPYLPGMLAHRGYGPERIVEHLFLSTEGIFGVPLGVSADFVYLFVLFGTVLEAAGGGKLLITLANGIAGKSRGGAAKTAALSSAIMGSLSGSAVANVVTTGTLTIPVMLRTGLRPAVAGAVEAAASTGGQLMPPVMGAGAFILATWTNIPYLTVALGALIPAVLYYLALFMVIHFHANKHGLQGDEVEDKGVIKGEWHLLAPVVVIVVMLAMGRSPMRAAFWGVVFSLVAVYARAETRLSLAGLARTLVRAAGGAVQVAAACAAAGVVVGMASLTGIGLRMSDLIVTLSGGALPIALLLTAVGSIVLGMGLPTTAAYVVLAALGAPALVELGVPLLAAHLFIFYFGCLSNVTPPVALAGYAAAGVANASPMRTSFNAMGFAGAGFLIPFVFVYDGALLLQKPWGAVAVSFGSAALSVTVAAAVVVGFGRYRMLGWERAIFGLCAGILLLPVFPAKLIAAVVVGLMYWRHVTKQVVLSASG